jgi:hypothetical protein
LELKETQAVTNKEANSPEKKLDVTIDVDVDPDRSKEWPVMMAPGLKRDRGIWGSILKCMEVDWWTRGTAIYGAVLATGVGISQLLKDRAKVSVGAMLELVTDAGSTRIEFLVVKATNVGRRTVTIEGIFTCEGKSKHFWGPRSARKFPKMLEPTQEIAERMSPGFYPRGLLWQRAILIDQAPEIIDKPGIGGEPFHLTSLLPSPQL